MFELRKSYPRIFNRAIKKCELFGKDAVCVYCTNIEFLVLCQILNQTDHYLYERFNTKTINNISSWFYFDKEKIDDHYIGRMKQWGPR